MYVPWVSDTRVLKGGLSDYEWALASAPELGQVLLRDWLETVHKDIISGWDFEGEVSTAEISDYTGSTDMFTIRFLPVSNSNK